MCLIFAYQKFNRAPVWIFMRKFSLTIIKKMSLLQQLSSTLKYFRAFSSSQLHPKRQRQHMHFPRHSLMGATRYKITVSPFPPKLGVI